MYKRQKNSKSNKRFKTTTTTTEFVKRVSCHTPLEITAYVISCDFAGSKHIHLCLVCTSEE
ncbi:hypothetical protein BaRGS_00032982, partial [Batillaria attramentaria]